MKKKNTKPAKMTYGEFTERFNAITDSLRDLLVASNVPTDAWLADYEILCDAIPDSVGEYLDD